MENAFFGVRFRSISVFIGVEGAFWKLFRVGRPKIDVIKNIKGGPFVWRRSRIPEKEGRP